MSLNMNDIHIGYYSVQFCIVFSSSAIIYVWIQNKSDRKVRFNVHCVYLYVLLKVFRLKINFFR